MNETDAEHETKQMLEEYLTALLADIDELTSCEVIEEIKKLYDQFYLPW